MPRGDQGAEGHAPEGRLSGEAFAERFRASADRLWTVAAAVLGGPDGAEDVLQEACVIALEKLDAFEPGTRFDAWMASIVRNVARNVGRKERRRATRPEDPDRLAELPGPGPAPAGLRLLGDEPDLPVGPRGELREDAGWFDDALLGALRELRPEVRACLLLRAVLGLEYRELAPLVGVNEGTAMSHVHRARARLRERLGGRAGERLEQGA